MNLEDYLKNNISNPKEVSNTMSFYSNFNSLNELYSKIEIYNSKLLRAQGKYNSKICFIFRDEMHFQSCLENLNRVLNVYGVKIWDIIILYFDKFQNNDANINILSEELCIINPLVIYIYDNNNLDKALIASRQEISNIKIINVNNIKNILDSDLPENVFDLFNYLITYNY
jgi:hypothetical protein